MKDAFDLVLEHIENNPELKRKIEIYADQQKKTFGDAVVFLLNEGGITAAFLSSAAGVVSPSSRESGEASEESVAIDETMPTSQLFSGTIQDNEAAWFYALENGNCSELSKTIKADGASERFKDFRRKLFPVMEFGRFAREKKYSDREIAKILATITTFPTMDKDRMIDYINDALSISYTVSMFVNIIAIIYGVKCRVITQDAAEEKLAECFATLKDGSEVA